MYHHLCEAMETVTKKSATIKTRMKNLFTFGGLHWLIWFNTKISVAPPISRKIANTTLIQRECAPPQPFHSCAFLNYANITLKSDLISISSLCLVQTRKTKLFIWYSVIKIREGLNGTESTFNINGNFRTVIWNLRIDVQIWCIDLQQYQIL